MTVDDLRQLREHFTQEQAENILTVIERRSGTYVTRDYLDARINQLLNDVTWRMIGLGVVVVTAVGLLDKLVRP